MKIIGLDIGGANLKAARADGSARSRVFELWKYPDMLGRALGMFVEDWVPAELAVTMTGELCDCFATKREGVSRILDEVERAFPRAAIHVWTTAGEFVTPKDARQNYLKAAAANWNALATLAGRLIRRECGEQVANALMIDVGSTTTDIIPLHQGLPISSGQSDAERLKTRELVYTGARRTPICALLHDGVMAELFATSHDAYLSLGMVPDAPHDHHTADGRPATAHHAHGRLARMLGGDPQITPVEETKRLAMQVFDRQRAIIADAVRTVAGRLPAPPEAVIFFGSGEFLAEAAWHDFAGQSLRHFSLSTMIGREVSMAACAYAVAVLAEEKCHFPTHSPS
jgi:probable H4MPT-linked C1 transfer pathway protein